MGSQDAINYLSLITKDKTRTTYNQLVFSGPMTAFKETRNVKMQENSLVSLLQEKLAYGN